MQFPETTYCRVCHAGSDAACNLIPDYTAYLCPREDYTPMTTIHQEPAAPPAARPDEPTFLLMGRDPDAHVILTEWADRRDAASARAGNIGPDLAATEARAVADMMRDYAAHPANIEAAAPLVEAYPPTPAQVLADTRKVMEASDLKGLVVRFFRAMVLGGIIIPDTPAAMDWLRDYIDGSKPGHGPLGQQMIWPDALPTVCNLLREWGYQPTYTRPAYVSRKVGA